MELDWELPFYRCEVVQTALEMQHQTTVFPDPLHSQARACQVQNKIQQHRKRTTRHTLWNQKFLQYYFVRE